MKEKEEIYIEKSNRNIEKPRSCIALVLKSFSIPVFVIRGKLKAYIFTKYYVENWHQLISTVVTFRKFNINSYSYN